MPLIIFGAVYGLNDVTEKVRSLISKDDTLVVRADNEIFGDAWFNNRKTLVVVYQGEDDQPCLAIVEEGQELRLNASNTSAKKTVVTNAILGAVYGRKDVTELARNLIRNNSLVVNSKSVWGDDNWPGICKSLVIFYLFNGIPQVNISVEGSAISLSLDSIEYLSRPSCSKDPLKLRELATKAIADHFFSQFFKPLPVHIQHDILQEINNLSKLNSFTNITKLSK